jgi:hypothetical protein
MQAANGGDLPVRVVETDAVTHDNVVAGALTAAVRRERKTGERNERSDH